MDRSRPRGFTLQQTATRGDRLTLFFRLCGLASVVLGIIGIFLPVMPTVPFLILAAFCFARSNPEWERRILAHPRFGPPVMAWRERGAIGPVGKIASVAAFTASALFGLFILPPPWAYLPLAVGVVCGSWILTRPSR